MESKCIISYDLRPDDRTYDRWTVYNTKTGHPALVRGVWQTSLPFADADDLVDLLNAMERAAPGSSVTWADGSR
ncbi:hypothetical protein FPV16_24330 [Methylobacterium sp. W2]|nr:hypothetical protein [Methylobacterium sp. W2]